jgi:peroxin-5
VEQAGRNAGERRAPRRCHFSMCVLSADSTLQLIYADRTALSIRPNFTRSLYNLGVSCLNINCFQEAAEHLLAALELQGTAGKGEEADGLWQTLRRTFVCMVRSSSSSRGLR